MGDDYQGMKESEEHMRAVGALLSRHFEGFGFALVVFPFGEPEIPRAANYISNAQREDMIRALREAADQIEGNQDIPPIEGSA